MRCFYHHETEAIGICMSCLRGVCPACANDLGDGLACRDRCEARVRTRLSFMRPDYTRSRPKVAMGVSLAIGVGMLIFAIWSLSRSGVIYGLVFFLFAAAFLFNGFYVLSMARARS
jgi:hypothetical protein